MDYVIAATMSSPDDPPPNGPVTLSLRRATEKNSSRNVDLTGVSAHVFNELNQLVAHRTPIDFERLVSWAAAREVIVTKDEVYG